MFGGWDIYEDTAYEAAVAREGSRASRCSNQVKEPLQAIQPDEGGLRSEYVKRINGPNVKQAPNNMDKARMLMDDIQQFQATTDASPAVMIWCGSTEVFHQAGGVPSDAEGVRRRVSARTIRKSRPARSTRTPR